MATAKRKKTTIKKVDQEIKGTDSMSIEEQTAKFLAGGGEIQQIPNGVSGQVQTSGPRHITLGKRHQTN